MMKLADYLIQQPLYAYGQGIYTAPQQQIRSPLEGLANALTRGLGGYIAGQGISQAKDEQKLDQTALAEAMTKYTSDPAAARALLASRPNLSDTAAQLLASDVGYQRQVDLLKTKQDMETDQLNAERTSMGLPALAKTGAPAAAAGPQQAQPQAPQQPSPNQTQFIQMMAPHAQAISQATGLDPKLVLAQSALETGYGASAPGNNYFGIKGQGQVLPTQEAGPNGMVGTRDSFRTYPDVGASAADYAQFLKTNSRYAPVLQAQGLDAQIDAMGKSGYATDPNYAAKLRQFAQSIQMPGQVAQGATPQVAPGAAPPAPQTAANSQPQGDTITYAGIDLPRAEVAAAMGIRDQKERASKLTDIVREAVKRKEGPDAGTTAGDVHVLDQVRNNPALASDPAYRAAYNRVAEPKMSQNGQLLPPDMSAYPTPITEGGQKGPQTQLIDTPQSRFQMANKLADDFNQMDPVKRYGVVEPVFRSMQETATKNDKLSDANLVYGISTIFDPGSVVRDGERLMIIRAQSLPDQVKGWINSINGGSGISPETRQAIMREAGSRVGALKAQQDSIAAQFSERAQRYGLDPRDVITNRAAATPAQEQPAAGAPIKIDINGNRR